MRDSFIARLTQMADADSRIILITGDLGFGVLDEYRKRFPNQFINAGVAEQNMTGLATGLALEGHIVFTYSIGNFVFMRCLEQIRNDAAYHNCNVNVVSVGGGFSYGALGISHHATEDLAIMRSLPELTVMSPGDEWEAAEATAAVAATTGVSYLRLDKSYAVSSGNSNEHFQLGRARCVRNGADFTLAATGGILSEALAAADALAQDGIECRVLSVHSIKPFDQDSFIKAAKETGGIATIEEHTVNGGLGSAVAESILDAGLHLKHFYRFGLRGGFCSTVGSQGYLRKQHGLDYKSIVKKISSLLNQGGHKLNSEMAA